LSGDEILRAIVARLRANLRADDLIARVGGDEFAIHMSNLHDTSVVIKLRGKIERVFAEPFVVQGLPVKVQASIGFSVVEPVHTDSEALLAAADAALFAAKHYRA
jgi:diguanylate cyclase (GGDEF)-like protein